MGGTVGLVLRRNIVQVSWEVLVGEESPAVTLGPRAKAGGAPALPRVLVGRGGPGVSGRGTAGAEAGMASAFGTAAPTGAASKIGGEEAQQVGGSREALGDSEKSPFAPGAGGPGALRSAFV